MQTSLEEAAQYLPNLGPEQKRRLYEDLRRLPSGVQYYFSVADLRLQGDIRGDAPFFSHSGSGVVIFKSRVMILSNSCDISDANERDVPSNITLAPVQRLSRWRKLLEDHGVNADKIAAKERSLREQKISNAFFLPSGAKLPEDCVVLFDHVQSMPLSAFEKDRPATLGSLSQSAHWLLLLKLSIHFSRLHEDLDRYAVAAGAAAA